MVVSAEPDSHRPVAGRFDLQRLDRTRLAVCWAAHDEHARLLGEYRQREQKMPLAVVIGGDPAFLLAAAAPLPPGSDICAVAGLLREKSLDVVAGRASIWRCRPRPRSCSKVLSIPRSRRLWPGRFAGRRAISTQPRPAHGDAGHHGDASGQPHLRGHGPRPAAARGFDRCPGDAAGVLPLARLVMPELVDYDLPAFAAARLWAAVSIRKTYPGQGRRAAHAAWGLPATRFAKMLVIVDEDVDVHDQQQVLAAVAINVRPGRDVLIEHGPANPFDPARADRHVGREDGFRRHAETRTGMTGQLRAV